MASDSQTTTATTSEKPLENKVKEEAKLMEKEIVVLQETADCVVKDKPVSDSNLNVKEEILNQTPAGEPEKEPLADVEEVVKADENGEKKIAEEVELTEPAPVKQMVEEVNVEAADAEKTEGKGKDVNGEEKVAEQVEIKEPTLVGVEEVKLETVDAEKAEEKQAVESVVEEANKDKDETKVVDVSASTNEAGGEQVSVQLVREVPAETVEEKVKDVEVLQVEPKPESAEKVETQPEKANELAPDVEVVKTEETEQAKVEPEGNQAPKKETEVDASSPSDVTEKAITEEKHVVEEPSKDEQENVTKPKDVLTKVATEEENIKKDNETPAADVKSEETLKETEGTKQEEPITEKVAEVVEAAPVVKESEEPKQEAEVTTKEVSVKPKSSNSIMSKVKKSLVKAKKAIIGKSPSSKTIITEESKEEVKAK